MIIYHHPTETTPPAWLTGAENVTTRPCEGGCLFGVGDHYLLGLDGRDGAKPLADGWSVWVNGGIDPYELARPCAWAAVAAAIDLHHRAWAVPVVLGATGKPCIRVAYGDDFLPDLTPEQQRIIDIAQVARAALEAAYSGEHRVPLDQRTACAWAAEALAITNAVTVQVIRRLSILDDALVAGTLLALTSYRVPEVAGGPE